MCRPSYSHGRRAKSHRPYHSEAPCAWLFLSSCRLMLEQDVESSCVFDWQVLAVAALKCNSKMKNLLPAWPRSAQLFLQTESYGLLRLSQHRRKSNHAFNRDFEQERVVYQNESAFGTDVRQFTCPPRLGKRAEQDRKIHVEAQSCPSISGTRRRSFTATRWLHNPAVYFQKPVRASPVPCAHRTHRSGCRWVMSA